MEVRVFPRDENLDIMNEYLKNGEFLSIPVPVFYTDSMDEIGHWHERPVAAIEETPRITEQTKSEMPNADEQGIPPHGERPDAGSLPCVAEGNRQGVARAACGETQHLIRASG